MGLPRHSPIFRTIALRVKSRAGTKLALTNVRTPTFSTIPLRNVPDCRIEVQQSLHDAFLCIAEGRPTVFGQATALLFDGYPRPKDKPKVAHHRHVGVEVDTLLPVIAVRLVPKVHVGVLLVTRSADKVFRKNGAPHPRQIGVDPWQRSLRPSGWQVLTCRFSCRGRLRRLRALLLRRAAGCGNFPRPLPAEDRAPQARRVIAVVAATPTSAGDFQQIATK
jgi:hypothetical protein